MKKGFFIRPCEEPTGMKKGFFIRRAPKEKMVQNQGVHGYLIHGNPPYVPTDCLPWGHRSDRSRVI